MNHLIFTKILDCLQKDRSKHHQFSKSKLIKILHFEYCLLFDVPPKEQTFGKTFLTISCSKMSAIIAVGFVNNFYSSVFAYCFLVCAKLFFLNSFVPVVTRNITQFAIVLSFQSLKLYILSNKMYCLNL